MVVGGFTGVKTQGNWYSVLPGYSGQNSVVLFFSGVGVDTVTRNVIPFGNQQVRDDRGQ